MLTKKQLNKASNASEIFEPSSVVMQFRPRPTIKVPPLLHLKFAYNNFKRKENHVRAY